MAAGDLRIGVDLGGTNLQAAVIDRSGRIVARAHRAHADDAIDAGDTSPDAVADRIVRAADEAVAAAGADRGALAALGVAAAGATDVAAGVVLEAPNLGWRDVPLRRLLHERTGLPIVVENDVNAAAWAEHRAIAGDAARADDATAGDLLAVWVGTGIGGGLVVGGELFRGTLGTAGEFGQWVIDAAAPEGTRRLEDHASRTGMRRRIVEAVEAGGADARACPLAGRTAESIGTPEIAAAFAAGDPLVVGVVESAAALVGLHAANAATLLAFGTLVVGGGMTEALGAPFVRAVAAAFRAAVFPAAHAERIRIETTRLGPDAGIVGAALLARSD